MEQTPMNYKTLVAASLMSIALTSTAFAQCIECAIYPDRDYLNKGAPTLASKMMAQSAGASTANSENNASNARAEARGAGTRNRHYRDANASIARGSAPANTGVQQVYIKNLRDSGYNPARDFNAAGNVRVY
jgi:hypothetical protein